MMAEVHIEENPVLGASTWSVAFDNFMPADPQHVPGQPHLVVGAAVNNSAARQQAHRIIEAFSSPPQDQTLAQPAEVRVFPGYELDPEEPHYEDQPTITLGPHLGGYWDWSIMLPSGYPDEAGYIPGRPSGVFGYAADKETALRESASARRAIDPEAAIRPHLLRIFETPLPPGWTPDSH